MLRPPPISTLFPYTTLFRSSMTARAAHVLDRDAGSRQKRLNGKFRHASSTRASIRSEEHTSELQSLRHLVCRLLLEKKKKKSDNNNNKHINHLTTNQQQHQN